MTRDLRDARRKARFQALGPLVRRHQPATHRGTDHLLAAAEATGVTNVVAQSWPKWTRA